MAPSQQEQQQQEQQHTITSTSTSTSTNNNNNNNASNVTNYRRQRRGRHKRTCCAIGPTRLLLFVAVLVLSALLSSRGCYSCCDALSSTSTSSTRISVSSPVASTSNANAKVNTKKAKKTDGKSNNNGNRNGNSNNNNNGNSNNNNNNNNNNISIRLVANNMVENNPEHRSLRACRRTAFQADKQNWMNSERDFVDARSVLDGKHLCVVAVDTSSNSNSNELEIVGSADLYPRGDGKTNTVMNVFVRPDQRGRGIGRRLMVEGIEDVLVPLLEEPNARPFFDDNDGGGGGDAQQQQQQQPPPLQRAVLSLDVYTQNTAAIELYLKLGYEPASPMHAGTLGLARAIRANLVVTLSKTVVAPKAY